MSTTPAPVTVNDSQPIKAEELRFTWSTGWLSAVTSVLAGLGAGLGALAKQFADIDIDPQILRSLVILAAVGIAVTAVVASVDVFARAWITVTQAKLAGTITASVAARGTPNVQLSPLPTTGIPFKLRVRHEGPELFTVLAMTLDHDTQKERYLVGRQDEGPKWITSDQIDRASYQAEPQPQLDIAAIITEVIAKLPPGPR